MSDKYDITRTLATLAEQLDAAICIRNTGFHFCGSSVTYLNCGEAVTRLDPCHGGATKILCGSNTKPGITPYTPVIREEVVHTLSEMELVETQKAMEVVRSQKASAMGLTTTVKAKDLQKTLHKLADQIGEIGEGLPE